jgi:preprotein translocase subunit SecG
MNLVLAVQLLSALAMIGLVLVQHGKGADMGASFGSGASGSLFGATGSANFLSRSDGGLRHVFFVCTLVLASCPTPVAGRAPTEVAAACSSVRRPAASAAVLPARVPAHPRRLRQIPTASGGAIPGAGSGASQRRASQPSQNPGKPLISG